MKAKDLKNILVPLELCGKTFKIAFDFNAICELDEVYGEMDEAINAMKNGKGKYKALRALVYSSIKPRNEKITLVEVGELLTEAMSDTEKANYIMGQLNKAMELASPNMEEGE